ncbi:hypothetical protein [Streptomyces spiralis]
MTREELLAKARTQLWAAWALSSEEIGSQGARALLEVGMLVPEGGAQELERLRARVAEQDLAYERLRMAWQSARRGRSELWALVHLMEAARGEGAAE